MVSWLSSHISIAGSLESRANNSRKLPIPYSLNISTWLVTILAWISLVAAVAKIRCQNRHIFSRRTASVLTIPVNPVRSRSRPAAKVGLVNVIPPNQVIGQTRGVGAAQQVLDGSFVVHPHIVVQLVGCGPEPRAPQQMRHERNILPLMHCRHVVLLGFGKFSWSISEESEN